MDDNRIIIPCIKRKYLHTLVDSILSDRSNPLKQETKAWYIYKWVEYELYYMLKSQWIKSNINKILDILELTTKHSTIDELVEFGKFIANKDYKSYCQDVAKPSTKE